MRMRDLRIERATDVDQDDLREQPERVELQRVVGMVTAPILGTDSVPADDVFDGTSPELMVGRAIETPVSQLGLVRAVEIATLFVAAAAVAFTTGEPNIGVGCGLVLFAAWSLRSVSERRPFSFGEGFVGYRPDPARAHGVQEEDDVRWDWRPKRAVPNAGEVGQRVLGGGHQAARSSRL